MNWQLFFSIYVLIFAAELPDKTAFATILLAARGRALAVFVGVATAFLVQTLVAIIFGGVIGLLPPSWVHLGAGILFLGFAAQTWRTRNKKEDEFDSTPDAYRKVSFWSCTWKSFLVIFIAEWGDLTQIATASLVAKYHDHPYVVFFAALLALWSVTLIAIFIGQRVKRFVSSIFLKKFSAILFALIGFYFVYTWRI